MFGTATRYVCPAARAAVLACVAAMTSFAAERQLVVVVNWADTDSKTLAQAQAQAATVLRHAGIDLIWEEGRVEPDGSFVLDPVLRASHALLIHLLSAKRPKVNFALGYAVADEGGRDTAYVICRRTGIARGGVSVSEGQAMGYVMAHELGHLLSIRNHDPTGIMRAQWAQDDFWRMARGEMFFTAAEADQMRAAVRQRAEK